jgi:hypothetical protein
MYHSKAHNVIYRTTEVETVTLHAYSTQRATKQSKHKAKIDKSPHIYMDKTTVEKKSNKSIIHITLKLAALSTRLLKAKVTASHIFPR